jgi:hypothetical protein
LHIAIRRAYGQDPAGDAAVGVETGEGHVQLPEPAAEQESQQPAEGPEGPVTIRTSNPSRIRRSSYRMRRLRDGLERHSVARRDLEPDRGARFPR